MSARCKGCGGVSDEFNIITHSSDCLAILRKTEPQKSEANTELDAMIIEVRHGRMSNTKAKAIIKSVLAQKVAEAEQKTASFYKKELDMYKRFMEAAIARENMKIEPKTICDFCQSELKADKE